MGHPKLDLTSKTAVVIGGTSGIGLALCKGLAEAGANVVPTGRREELIRSAATEIEKLGRKSMVVTSDVTDRSSLERLHNAVLKEFGRIDILVNCAGMTKRTPTLDVSEEEWDKIIETNLNGTLRACQVFGRKMIEQKYGRVINIAYPGLVHITQRGGRIQCQQGCRRLFDQDPCDRMVASRSLRECHRSRSIPHRTEFGVA